MAHLIRRRLREGSAALLVVSVAAGCTGGGSAAEPPASVRQGKGATPASVQIGVPEDQRRRLNLAAERLIQGCMRAAGFRYTVKPPGEGSRSPLERRGDDVALARTDGYGTLTRLRDRDDQEDLGDRAAPPSDPDTDALSRPERVRFTRTLHGTRREEIRTFGGGVMTFGMDGCQAKAFGRLYGDVRKYLAVSVLADNVEGLARGRVTQDPEYRSAVKKWSACMSGRGYHFADPNAAREAATALYDVRSLPARPLRREIEQAVADAECHRSARLADIDARLYEKALRASVKQYESELLTYLELQRAALRRADEILK